MDINTQVILQMKARHEADAKPEQEPRQKRVRKTAKSTDKSIPDTEEKKEA